MLSHFLDQHPVTASFLLANLTLFNKLVSKIGILLRYGIVTRALCHAIGAHLEVRPAFQLIHNQRDFRFDNGLGMVVVNLAVDRTLEKAYSAKQETLVQLQEAQLSPKTKPGRIQSLERRGLRRQQAIETAQKRLKKTLLLLQAQMEQEKSLRTRLQRFEQENADNPDPSKICFRLDAGFGTVANIALLIEMGYELYTKLYSHKVVQALQKLVLPENTWTRVGKNAEMVAWPALKLDNCPYPLSLGLERFHTGDKKLKHFQSATTTHRAISTRGYK